MAFGPSQVPDSQPARASLRHGTLNPPSSSVDPGLVESDCRITARPCVISSVLVAHACPALQSGLGPGIGVFACMIGMIWRIGTHGHYEVCLPCGRWRYRQSAEIRVALRVAIAQPAYYKNGEWPALHWRTSAGTRLVVEPPASAFMWGHRLPEDEPPAQPKFLPGALATGAGVVCVVSHPPFSPWLVLAL
jgi:hypothetical protein